MHLILKYISQDEVLAVVNYAHQYNSVQKNMFLWCHNQVLLLQLIPSLIIYIFKLLGIFVKIITLRYYCLKLSVGGQSIASGTCSSAMKNKCNICNDAQIDSLLYRYFIFVFLNATLLRHSLLLN
jgi:hypothetical protein